MTFIDLLLANLLAFYLTYLLAFYLAYLLAFYVAFYLAYLLGYLLPSYLANLLASYLANILTYLLAFYLTFCLAYLLAFYLAYFLAYVLAYLLAFYLAYLLAYLLTSYLAFYLANLLAFYLANILALYLAYHLTFYLAYLLAFYQAYLMAFYLVYLLAFYLTCYLAFYVAYLLAFYLAVEVQRCTLSWEGPRLRSSGAHWAGKVPGWGPAVHTELGRSQVEVQQCTLSWEVGKELGQDLASRKCRCKLMQTWSRRNWRRRRTRRTRRRTASRGGGEQLLIKSNNPHLAGGEILSKLWNASSDRKNAAFQSPQNTPDEMSCYCGKTRKRPNFGIHFLDVFDEINSRVTTVPYSLEEKMCFSEHGFRSGGMFLFICLSLAFAHHRAEGQWQPIWCILHAHQDAFGPSHFVTCLPNFCRVASKTKHRFLHRIGEMGGVEAIVQAPGCCVADWKAYWL